MPATSFDEYARAITDRLHTILHSGQARSLHLDVDQRSILQGVISGQLTFEDHSELHFREFIDTSQREPKLSFAYHYQGAQKALIFRYDNAAHRPSLLRHTHKHTPVNVIDCPASTLAEVIDEVLKGLRS
ncbi:MAG: hypothetical protein JXL84_22395 [Deltaproteobacteria bacterium]|nr:hypothetical protein [Deltaproteobacteria bacterium]